MTQLVDRTRTRRVGKSGSVPMTKNIDVGAIGHSGWHQRDSVGGGRESGIGTVETVNIVESSSVRVEKTGTTVT